MKIRLGFPPSQGKLLMDDDLVEMGSCQPKRRK